MINKYFKTCYRHQVRHLIYFSKTLLIKTIHSLTKFRKKNLVISEAFILSYFILKQYSIKRPHLETMRRGNVRRRSSAGYVAWRLWYQQHLFTEKCCLQIWHIIPNENCLRKPKITLVYEVAYVISAISIFF